MVVFFYFIYLTSVIVADTPTSNYLSEFNLTQFIILITVNALFNALGVYLIFTI